MIYRIRLERIEDKLEIDRLKNDDDMVGTLVFTTALHNDDAVYLETAIIDGNIEITATEHIIINLVNPR